MVAHLLLFRIGPAEEQKVIGHIGKRDLHLLTVKYPIIAVAFRARPHTDHV